MVATLREQSGSSRPTHAGPQTFSFKDHRPTALDLSLSLERLERLRISNSPRKTFSFRDNGNNATSPPHSILMRRRCKLGVPPLLQLVGGEDVCETTTPPVPVAPRSGNKQILLLWDSPTAQQSAESAYSDDSGSLLSPMN
mmetsp:Transcript_21979/g.60189  ORF Transcript_21979/g.60189 Transcript_21979/m.60189 type:complete len:141 (-) Transcript_21979:106-528(-)